jgi:hypothetical protein
MFTSNYKLRDIPHLRTGLNDKYDPSEISNTDMADCENIEVDTRSIRNAGGYVGYGNATGPYWGGFHAKFEDGTNRLIRQRQNKLEYDNGSGTWTECTLPTSGSPAEPISLTETACSFAMMNDTILWSNGSDDVLQSTDGITWTVATNGSPAESLPKAKVLFNNGKNRILYMAIPTEPSKVYWSDINQPTTIQDVSYQFIGKNDGQEIIDAVLLPNGSMLLLKTSRFYAISDITSDLIAVDPIGEAPCVRYTAMATENSVIWAGNNKIYEFDGARANVISDNIDIDGISKPTSMRAVYHNNKYRLAIPNGSDSYNSIELVVNRQLPTGNPLNPYAITKNERFIGCYILEDREVSDIRRRRVYFGDGRSTGIGSPAEIPTTFAYINDEHDTGVTQGLDGSAQTCTFTTKFFTEDVPFFIKRYKKWFGQVKSSTDQEITLSYRFDQFSAFIDVSITSAADDLDFLLEDDSEGGFTEGYSFAYEATESIFKDLETTGSDIRGIQFKITWSSIQDVEILSQAYKFKVKNNFH